MWFPIDEARVETFLQYNCIKHVYTNKSTKKVNIDASWSEMTLDYWVIVERYPFSNEVVGDSIFRWEIFSPVDGKN